MWRYMLRTMPRKIHCACLTALQPKITNRIKVLAKSGFLMTSAYISINQLSNDNIDIDNSYENEDNSDTLNVEIDELQLAADIRLTCAESCEALNNLIKTLHACVQEICDQYQHCITKQIEITLMCMELNSTGPHWDEITKYRVIADDLRVELIKYKNLINNIGSIVKNEKQTKGDTIVIKSYQELLELIEKKSNENNYLDKKLLDVHRKSILASG